MTNWKSNQNGMDLNMDEVAAYGNYIETYASDLEF
jgi:hypothetical protein